MKKHHTILTTLLFMVAFTYCTEEDTPKNLMEQRMDYLENKSQGWRLQSVVVPEYSATAESEWSDFQLSVTPTSMTTSGNAEGASAVWPSGACTINEEGTVITRSDGIKMTIIALTETTFNTSFIIPDGVVLSGRILALDGEYIFNLY